MKALLYTLDGKIKEFEVRGATPYFILVERDKELNDQGIPIGVVKGSERLFRLANDAFSGGVGFYVESGVTPEYFKKRETEARIRYNYDYANEMKRMAEIVSSPEFLAPVVGKIERYAEWVPGLSIKMPEPTLKPVSIIKKFDPGPKWDPPFQTVFVDDKANLAQALPAALPYKSEYGDPYEDKPFTNVTYTPKPEPPPIEPDVIGEPKKRLLLIPKENHEAVPSVAASDTD